MILAVAAGCWIPLPSAQGAEIRLASGIRLHYETTGVAGTPVVLVHGYGMSSVVWESAPSTRPWR